jgi:hypothetical protein
MDGSGELIDLVVVERVLLALAVGLPIAGLLVGLGWGAVRRRALIGALEGLGVGLLGPGVWVLWRVYNAIEDHYGLDSVKALLINLTLFLCVGAVVGVIVGTVAARRSTNQDMVDG